MIWKCQQRSLIVMMGLLHSANVQMPVAIYPGPQPVLMMPPAPPPPPVGVPVPYPVPVPVIVTQKTKRTTTTTERAEKEERIAVPVPYGVPMPVPYAVPAAPPPSFCVSRPRSPGCPACPPCACGTTCTPSFFSYCSPCHQQCRCRNENPRALPPMPPPPPPPMPMYPLPPPVPSVVVYPFPAPPPRLPVQYARPRSSRWRDCGSDDDDTSGLSTDWDDDVDSYDSDDYDRHRLSFLRMGRKRSRKPRGKPDSKSGGKPSGKSGLRARKRRLRSKYYRKSLRRADGSDNEFVKPMLTYLSKKGNVKYQQPISADDAAKLMGEKEIHSERDAPGDIPPKESKQFVINNGDARRMKQSEKMSKGHELIFRPPPNRKISNLSVSFHLDG